jgi:hypothetical protein
MPDLWSANPRSVAIGPLPGMGSGFTADDLHMLLDVQAAAMLRGAWGRGALNANVFADYLAMWSPDAGGETDPTVLVLARFKRTGTYLLTVASTVVASGRSLRDLLPALSSAPAKAAAPNL